ncbi:MAG TPA: restriction endonuclease [Pyrinomonadaceae bacterium]|nr:restriction endonuclease [Acidobacteriota bacterium]HQZ98078.1 restriction endonuclease [Pyrinomonadaceae bacterium]
MNWSDYQKKAAEFFSSLGLKTEIERKLEGVRTVHAVDVYVSGNFSGVEFIWIVECKAWKNNIPKEKVMALTSIVQDIGADRGFLLSEVGFQSGAILAARSSNITLTSLEDLSASAEKFSIDTLIGRKVWEVQKAKSRLLELRRKSDAYKYNPFRVGLFGELSVFELLLDDALQGKYPVVYPTKGHSFTTLEELFAYGDQIIEQANVWDL